LGSYLFCRTKKLLNVHRDLPLVLNRSIEYLLAFETTTTEVELGEKGDEYKMKVCNMLAYYDWRHVFRALYFGLEGPLQFDYSDGTHLYPTLSSDEQDLADKLAVATYFHNRHAISTIIRAGAKPWMASYTFGYPLSISAVRGNLHGTLNAILGNIPKLITKKTVDYSLILDMFYNTIAAVSAQEEYDAATYLTEWFSKRVSAQPKHAYDKRK
jgi:hypothetical protein